MALDKISDFKSIHQGKRLFILASGPSLSDLDLSALKNKLVMGLNRSFFSYPDTYYHCCMDQRLFDLHPDLLQKTRYLFTLEGRPWGIPLKLLGSEGYSFDLENGVYSGYTISYVAMQIAVYMGFQQIFFLGLDLCHRQGNTHFFGKDFHSRNHETTEFPKMIRMLERGAEELQKHEVELFNCSPVADLKGFQKATFEYAISL